MVKFERKDASRPAYINLRFGGGITHEFIIDDDNPELNIPATTTENKTLVKYLRRNLAIREV